LPLTKKTSFLFEHYICRTHPASPAAGSFAAFPLPFFNGISVLRAAGCKPTNTKPLTGLVFTKQYFTLIGELHLNQAKK
jgi:hypothetical protein